MNRQTCSSIRLCLTKDQKYFVMHETVAKNLCRKLDDKYMTKSVENRLYLKKKLFRFTYKDDTSMCNHLDAYDKILAYLRTLDVKITDEDKAPFLLNSLPEKYDHLSTTLLYGKKTISYELENIMSNNTVQKQDIHDTRESPFSYALKIRGSLEDKKYRSKGKFRYKLRGTSLNRKLAKDQYSYCKNKGHWKIDCPALKEKNKKS